MDGKFAEGQTYTEAARLILASQAGKLFEDALLVGLRNAGAIIPYPEFDKDPIRLGANLDSALCGCKLDRVFQKVDQHTLDHIHIDPNGRQVTAYLLFDRLMAAHG